MLMAKLPERCSDLKEQLSESCRTCHNRYQVAGSESINRWTAPRATELYIKATAECVAKGINQSFASAYCSPKAGKVTWTLNSVHKSRKAVDVVPQRKVNGKVVAIWNVKDPQTQIIIKTMEKYGLEAGANWTTYTGQSSLSS